MTGLQTDRKCGLRPPIVFFRTTIMNVPVTREYARPRIPYAASQNDRRKICARRMTPIGMVIATVAADREENVDV